MPLSSSFFPLKRINKLWKEIEPRNYPRVITPQAMTKAFLAAYLRGLPGLRAVAKNNARMLGECDFTALSHALAKSNMACFVEALLRELAPRYAPDKSDVVAIDAMPVTIPATYRHNCKSINRWTVGGGVLWAFNLTARRGSNPARILNIIEGGQHEGRLIREAELIINGPIYLMDRGFYSIKLVARWIDEGVRFIVRGKDYPLLYEVVEKIGRKRWVGRPRGKNSVRIEEDAIVRLGAPERKTRPLVRLVCGRLNNGERLILVSGMFEKSAEDILSTYHQRWEIEGFHHFLKEAMGLAHLYSFHQNGLSFLIQTAFLLCVLLLMSPRASRRWSLSLDVLRLLLIEERESLGLYGLWRRNTVRKGQTRHRKKE